jgi:hypothetical protein
VLEHLDDPRAILEAVRAVMVSKGVLVLETPNCAGVSAIVTKDDYRKIHPLEHINGFTFRTLKGIAERAGFTHIRAPEAHVTASRSRVVKTEIKRLLSWFRPPTTQLYFRKS